MSTLRTLALWKAQVGGVVLSACLGLSGGSVPQQEDGQEPEGFRIGVAVNQIFLPVSVRYRGGGFVEGLTQEDFLVYENGVLQHIENFYSERVPVKVVLLVDASGSTYYSQADIRRAAIEFAKRLSPEDQVAVVSFNHQAKLLLDFTSDPDLVDLALKKIYAKGNTVLYDALYVTFDDLLKGVNTKTAVILLTDGIDTGSMVSFQDVLQLTLQASSPIYVVSKVDEYRAEAIGLRRLLRSRNQIIPDTLEDAFIQERAEGLKRLADLTGGRYLSTRDFASLTDIYGQVAEELKHQYFMSYVPVNRERDGSWRSIEVKVRRGDVVARTRRGYYALGPDKTVP
ncbi:MAG TPA: VWA domain-containing protein [Acidobacteriota bacterium]|nr:VWA domain-containing protein [Acidobacteriota bacterium]